MKKFPFLTDLSVDELRQIGITAYGCTNTAEIVFLEEIRHICEGNLCRNYGKTWACPPAVGRVEECKSRCLRYPEGLLLVTLTEVSDIADMEETLATRPAHEAVTREAAALLRAQGLEVMGLSTDSCAICRECSYPNAPCRHPEQMYPCVESHGIVVTALAEKRGIDYLYGGNIVTWFSLLLYREERETQDREL